MIAFSHFIEQLVTAEGEEDLEYIIQHLKDNYVGIGLQVTTKKSESLIVGNMQQ